MVDMLISKRSLICGLFATITIVLSACGTVSEQTESSVDVEAPATYAEYKRWRELYDPDAKAYAEYKAWEEQYRRWQFEQQRQLEP